MSQRLRILHISDLHERAEFDGMPSSRKKVLQLDAEERGIVLGRTFHEALKEMRTVGVDIVCFTGDITDWGHPNEYLAATRRIGAILETVGLSWERFFAVPGNHDVQRTIHEEVWKGIRSWRTKTRWLVR